MHGDHVATADDRASGIAIGRLGADHDDGAEADDDQQQVEIADEAGGIEHALARFLGVADGKEAHQDMRQAGRAEHHAQPQRNGIHRAGQQTAWGHDRLALGMHGHGTGEHRLGAEAEVPEHHERHEAGAGQQHHCLDDLHPGGGEHAAKGDVGDHQHADQHHRIQVADAEQQLDQLAGADHLRDQVHQRHHQGAECRGEAHRGLRQAVADHVGEGVLAQVAQALGDQEQDDRPAGEHAQRIQQAVVAVQEHHRRNTQERGGADHVAGDRQAVLHAAEAPAGGIEVTGRAGAQGSPAGDQQGEADEHHEHRDGCPVHCAHSCLTLSLSGSSALLARCT